MKIDTKKVVAHTYSIEGMTAQEAAAVCFLLGKARQGLSTATYHIYSQLFDALEKTGDKELMYDFKAD